jgi:hypothetical protein
MSTPYSLLAFWRSQRHALFMWTTRYAKRVAWEICCGCLLAGSANAYTVVVLSTGVPTAIETQFIADTTNQFSAVIQTNPFFANTQTIVIGGINPNYNPPPTNMDYPLGWADGASYQQYKDTMLLDSFVVSCSTPSVFTLIFATTSTFDVSTCNDALNTANNSIFQESLSTPTVVPGNFQ